MAYIQTGDVQTGIADIKGSTVLVVAGAVAMWVFIIKKKKLG